MISNPGAAATPTFPDVERKCHKFPRRRSRRGRQHIDTAQAYGNEESVGRGLRDSGVPRDVRIFP